MNVSILIALFALRSLFASGVAPPATSQDESSTLENEICDGSNLECDHDIDWNDDEHLALIQRAASVMPKSKGGHGSVLKEQGSKHTAQRSVGVASDLGEGNHSRGTSDLAGQNDTIGDTIILAESISEGMPGGDTAAANKLEAGAGVTTILIMTAFPAISMAIGSSAIKLGSPGETLQLRLQHLSAGLLIGACLTNIFPILQEQLTGTSYKMHLKGVEAIRVIHWSSLAAAICGFGLAIAAMYGVKSLGLEEDDSDDESSNASPRDKKAAEELVTGDVSHQEGIKLRMLFSRLAAHVNSLSQNVKTDRIDREAVDEQIHGIDFLVDSARRLTKGAEPIDKRNAVRLRHHVQELTDDVDKLTQLDMDSGLIDGQLKAVAATLQHVHDHAERAVFRRWRPVRRWDPPEPAGDLSPRSRELLQLEQGEVPYALVLAVVLDSIVDGMLIGLAASVATESGILMAIATAIEMGFLGYSFACSIVQVMDTCRATAILAMPPIAMLIASTAAGAGATVVEGTPVFVALIAFALVALLFLVVDELLGEAKEKEESGEWHIGIWLYIGLIASITLDVVI